MSPLRVAIIGSSGAGKSTLARRLGSRLAAPVVELDAINWQAGWRDLATHDPEAFVHRTRTAIAGERWVSDGGYRVVLPLILARATDVVWLDYSRAVVMRRVIGRSILRTLTRRELWPGTGNREEVRRWLNREHPIRWAWATLADRRLRYGALFADLANAGVALHRLRRPRDAATLVETLARKAEASRREQI
jgi:adenylate kinase family enzyme